jgi:hypothetical protein
MLCARLLRKVLLARKCCCLAHSSGLKLFLCALLLQGVLLGRIKKLLLRLVAALELLLLPFFTDLVASTLKFFSACSAAAGCAAGAHQEAAAAWHTLPRWHCFFCQRADLDGTHVLCCCRVCYWGVSASCCCCCCLAHSSAL